MQLKEYNLKNGIKLHTMNTDKYKTNLIGVFLTIKLTKENVTKNALISALLRRGSKTMPSTGDISKQMEEMYGASFDCGLDKTGDNQVLKFYIETINDSFIPHKEENLLKMSIEKLLDIVFNPYIENDGFKQEYLDQEKNTIRQIIKGRKDNKARYAVDRCIEEMYKGESFGIYRFGYEEDLEKINAQELYNYYKNEFINSCKIDIYVSGIIDEETKKLVEENENIKKLKKREPNYVLPNVNPKEVKEEPNVVTESMEVTQGKLAIGLDVALDDQEQRHATLIYNAILGGSANSKLFQNVREKAHLAYAVGSNYFRYKNNIFINAGIKIENYEKALKIIKQQIEDMKNGDFSDEAIENAKKGVIATIKIIDDEQDTEVSYYFGQEISQNHVNTAEYIERINEIDRQKVLDIANKVTINTIYFLKN